MALPWAYHSDEGLPLEKSASETLYRGQFSLSTQLMKPVQHVLIGSALNTRHKGSEIMASYVGVEIRGSIFQFYAVISLFLLRVLQLREQQAINKVGEGWNMKFCERRQ